MSQDVRIFIVTAVIALVYLVIIPLLVRQKRIEKPVLDEAEAQTEAPTVTPTLTPIEGGGRPKATPHRRKAA